MMKTLRIGFESFMKSEKIILGEKLRNFEKSPRILWSGIFWETNGLDALKLILIAYIEMGIFKRVTKLLYPKIHILQFYPYQYRNQVLLPC